MTVEETAPLGVLMERTLDTLGVDLGGLRRPAEQGAENIVEMESEEVGVVGM